MTEQANEEIEGTTLCVYAYVVKEGRPVGTREVMRGANLSSPSVAFRQLQKLENVRSFREEPIWKLCRQRKSNCEWTCLGRAKFSAAFNVLLVLLCGRLRC